MDKKYLLNLIHQFQMVAGIMKPNINDDEFLQWLKSYQNVLLKLKEYYVYLGFDIEKLSAYEIGKGSLDSIINDKEFSISKYNNPQSELYIYNEVPYKISSNGMEMLNPDLIYTFNQYCNKELKNFIKLTQIKEQILMSMCGKIYDKDKITKINNLKILLYLLGNDIESEYVEEQDNYFYTIYSKQKTKRLIRLRG